MNSNFKKINEIKSTVDKMREGNRKLHFTPEFKRHILNVYKESFMSKGRFAQLAGICFSSLSKIIDEYQVLTDDKNQIIFEEQENPKQKIQSKGFWIEGGNLYVKLPKSIMKDIAVEYMKGL